MKKYIFIIVFIFFVQGLCYAEDYRKIYKDTPVPDFAYLHGIDPKHYFENKDASYSVYPLLRLSSPLYFKTITIKPGYYDLTPREHKGKVYILFKQNGIVVHILPTFKKETVPIDFYKTRLPEPKYTFTQKIGNAMHNFVGKNFKGAKRKQLAKTYLEVNDESDNFVVLVIYYNTQRYYVLTRAVKM
jgi:hypothetical protein